MKDLYERKDFKILVVEGKIPQIPNLTQRLGDSGYSITGANVEEDCIVQEGSFTRIITRRILEELRPNLVFPNYKRDDFRFWIVDTTRDMEPHPTTIWKRVETYEHGSCIVKRLHAKNFYAPIFERSLTRCIGCIDTDSFTALANVLTRLARSLFFYGDTLEELVDDEKRLNEQIAEVSTIVEAAYFGIQQDSALKEISDVLIKTRSILNGSK